jgi:fucose permease
MVQLLIKNSLIQILKIEWCVNLMVMIFLYVGKNVGCPLSRNDYFFNMLLINKRYTGKYFVNDKWLN